MSHRSTRNKIRLQADGAIKGIERAVEHLSSVDKLADGRSDQISETLCKLIVILDGVQKMLIRWRDTL